MHDSTARPLLAPRRLRPPEGRAPGDAAVPRFDWLGSVVAVAEGLLRVGAGPWTPPPRRDLPADAFALVILDGVLLRATSLGEDPALQILGTGDVIDPWRPSDLVLAAGTATWSAARATQVAVLGRRFLSAAGSRPVLTLGLQAQMTRQLERAFRHAAIAQLRRVEDRLLALLKALGDDHGRVTPDGILVELRLTHQTLGHLVGARRPTVSLALKALAERGLVLPSPSGWLVSRDATLLRGASTLEAPALAGAVRASRLARHDGAAVG